ncbi:uncharacterized protein LOC122504765 [Leptopilina heterotoma]|uniref:uncharacterized protein LOC122504765 n=1 Tax=Leptopilina heterotoma TaxID=63436 RepID=UPI001CAA185C|nr:uncharacterized protein LOC122504765 [Leptopilina heterotoma]
MESIETVNINKLTGSLNYDMWKFGVLLLIEAKGLRKYIDGNASEPMKSKSSREWNLWNEKKLETAMILLDTVDESMVPFLIDCKEPKDIWIRLEALYGQNITNYLINKNFYNKNNNNEIMFNNVREVENNKRSKNNIYSKKIAGIWNGACIKENKREEREIDNYSRKMAKIWNSTSLNEDDNEDKNDETESCLSLSSIDIYNDRKNNLLERNNIWLTNAGIKKHMTSRRDFFSHYEEFDEMFFVRVGGTVMRIFGTGSINFQVHIDGILEDRQMINVLYVPDLKMNLFSIIAVLENGYSFHSYKFHCEVRDKNNMLSCSGVRYKVNVFRLFFQVQVP